MVVLERVGVHLAEVGYELAEEVFVLIFLELLREQVPLFQKRAESLEHLVVLGLHLCFRLALGLGDFVQIYRKGVDELNEILVVLGLSVPRIAY